MSDAERYKAQRDNMLEFIKNADVSSGVCCCGDDMERHSNEHSPVDMWDHAVRGLVKEIEASDRAATDAPPAPEPKLPPLPWDLDTTNPRLTIPLKVGELVTVMHQWGREVYAAAQQAASQHADTAMRLLREARAALETWKDVAPAVSLCADIDKFLAPQAATTASADVSVINYGNPVDNSAATTASMSDGSIYEQVSRRADPEGHAEAMAQMDEVLGVATTASASTIKTWQQRAWEDGCDTELQPDPKHYTDAMVAEIADLRAALADAPLSNAEFLAKRLGRVAKLAGVTMPGGTYEQIAEVAGTILGEIARALETRATQSGTWQLIEDIATFNGARGMSAVNDLIGRAKAILAARPTTNTENTDDR